MENTAGEIARVLIVGAGAIGTAVAGAIADRDPASVSILASGERLAKYQKEGFILNGVRRTFALASPQQSRAPDLIIVAVKNHHLDEAIREMKLVVGPHTLIISLLNGISSEDSLGAAFGREKVPYAMILGVDAVREGNATRFSTGGVIHFGDARNKGGAWSPRVSRIASFFSRVGVPFNVPGDMVRSLWYKFMINVGVNQVSAIINGTYGLFQDDVNAQSVMEAAMAEVVAVSQAVGTGLEDADIKAWYNTLRTLAPEGKTSMLQDVEAGRETEVEAFAGTMIRLGRETGTPVPVNQTLYWLLKARSPR